MSEKNDTILVVEDESILRGVLVDTIKRNEFLTLEAKNGEEGLAIALREHPDLILLNVLLPKIDGMAVLRKLREDQWGNGVPVIFLTNIDPDAQRLKEIENYKASFYLIKTQTSMEQIVTKIKELLNTVPK